MTFNTFDKINEKINITTTYINKYISHFLSRHLAVNSRSGLRKNFKLVLLVHIVYNIIRNTNIVTINDILE